MNKQREIKFRIWDRQLHEWYKPTYEAYKGKLDELMLSLNGRLGRRTLACMEDLSLFPKRYIVNQYTGLKDNHRKGIYEGDIIQFEYQGMQYISKEDVSEGEWNENLEIITSVVVYEAPRFCLATNHFNRDLHSDETTEVIGNIYENPELINKQ